MELFATFKCGGDCAVTLLRPRSYGSLLKVKVVCNLCNEVKMWQSQPRIADIPAGNLTLSKGILFGGESPSKFLRTLKNSGVHTISPRRYHKHQATYLQPAVVNVWKAQQAALLAELRAKGEPVILGCDGRAESPGLYFIKVKNILSLKLKNNLIFHFIKELKKNRFLNSFIK